MAKYHMRMNGAEDPAQECTQAQRDGRGDHGSGVNTGKGSANRGMINTIAAMVQQRL